MKTYQLGMSLFELIVVLALIVILTMWALPAWQQQRAQLEKQRTLYLLSQAIQLAKQEARLRQRNVIICPAQTAERCDAQTWSAQLLMFVDLNNNKQFDPADHLLHQFPLQLKYGHLQWNGSLSRPYLQFQGDTGLPRGLIGHFLYCSQYTAHHFKLTLNMMGLTRHDTVTHC